MPDWLVIVLGYVIGSIPTAYLAGRLRGNRDIRNVGDANAGAANAYRELGPVAGVAVFFGDSLKGAAVIGIARAAYEFWLGGDFIKNDEPQGNQVFSPLKKTLPLVYDAMKRAQDETGEAKLFSLNITADDHFEMCARADFALETFGPDADKLAFLVDGYVGGPGMVTTARRQYPGQYLHYHRAGHGAVTSPSAKPVGRLIAVVGAKGGVGASTIAHNIAWAIARDDRAVLDGEAPIDGPLALGTQAVRAADTADASLRPAARLTGVPAQSGTGGRGAAPPPRGGPPNVAG